VQERAAGAGSLVDDLLGELDNLVALGLVLLPLQLDESCPTAPDAEHPVSLPQSADGQRPDRGVEARHVAAAGQDRNGSLLDVDVTHASLLVQPPDCNAGG